MDNQQPLNKTFHTGEAHRRWCLDFPRRRFLRGGLDAGEKVSQVAVSCMPKVAKGRQNKVNIV